MNPIKVQAGTDRRRRLRSAITAAVNQARAQPSGLGRAGTSAST
jgi:hypothetical protein